MGNRISRKKTKQAGTAPHEERLEVVRTPVAAVTEGPRGKKEVEIPLQAPLTARGNANRTEETPLEFFRHCCAVEDDDPFVLYSLALVLKEQQEFAASSKLLRLLLSNASLSLESQYHLAVCLIAQDPELKWCQEEATQCLEKVVAATMTSSKSLDVPYSIMYRQSLELLTYLMIADNRFQRALQLLEALIAIPADVTRSSDSIAQRQQQMLVTFQRSFCLYARGDSPNLVSSELALITDQTQEKKDEYRSEVSAIVKCTSFEGIELLLRADAVSLRERLALLAAISNSM